MTYVKPAVIGYILSSEFMENQEPSSFNPVTIELDRGLINIFERDVSGSFTGHHGGSCGELVAITARSKREMLEY